MPPPAAPPPANAPKPEMPSLPDTLTQLDFDNYQAIAFFDEEALHELLEAEDIREDGRVEAAPFPARERLARGSRARRHHAVELRARHADEIVEVGAGEGVRHAREHTLCVNPARVRRVTRHA